MDTLQKERNKLVLKLQAVGARDFKSKIADKIMVAVLVYLFLGNKVIQLKDKNQEEYNIKIIISVAPPQLRECSFNYKQKRKRLKLLKV